MVIKWLAASLAHRDLEYYTFANKKTAKLHYTVKVFFSSAKKQFYTNPLKLFYEMELEEGGEGKSNVNLFIL